MIRFRLTVEYDGGPFMGWQRQAHGPSVQQAIEEAVLAITGEQVTLHAAGRTDAGVHALAMSAHVDIERPITPFRLSEGLNARLRPQPVAILKAEPVADDWHARFVTAGLPVTAIDDMPWGMHEFTLTDPSGNHLRIGRNIVPEADQEWIPC